MSPHHSDQMSQRSQDSLEGLSLRVFSKRLCNCLCYCHFVGQVMCAHHSHHMSQGSQVSQSPVWQCFFNNV